MAGIWPGASISSWVRLSSLKPNVTHANTCFTQDRPSQEEFSSLVQHGFKKRQTNTVLADGESGVQWVYLSHSLPLAGLLILNYNKNFCTNENVFSLVVD